MSEVKLISPLLDGFAMGNPMSEHDGVRCCPAIKENTDKKYIVKVISVPATQAQLDALLLAGAYKDPADAMEYFRQVGERILEEAQLLKTLSRLDGFLPYEGWQMEPITRRRLGYQVYLVGSYKRSLEKHMKSHPVTHLEAINLGLDLCAALNVCREAGALYVALKPSNVFVSDAKEYRIGDLGFIQLDALRYSALPEKYLSPYTPPELFDPMANMNLTADTYALGMILYQLYNDGRLPFKGKLPPEEGLPCPLNADYEMAEIIMKAIDPDPANRWTDPKDMGKALAEYMQRNSINDVPITPHIPLDVNPEDIAVIDQEQEPESTEDAQAAAPEIPEEKASETVPEEAETAEESTDTEEATAEEPTPEDTAIGEASQEEVPVEAEEDPVSEETLPEEVPVPMEPSAAVVSPEFSSVIAQADDLIAHEPEVLISEVPEEADPFAFVVDEEASFEHELEPEEPVTEEESSQVLDKTDRKQQKKFIDPKYKRRKKKFAAFLATAAILALLGAGAYWYYQNLYLIHINDVILKAEQDSISVSVDAQGKEGAWVIKCIRSDGKTDTRGTSSGSTTFSGLEPNTTYTIQVEIDGFHKLVGETSDVITTEPTTKILNFSAAVGPMDGTVVLNFEMEGQEPKDWTVIYAAEGEDEHRVTFTGHTAAIADLTVGKVYHFRLDTGENIALGGQTTLEYMPSRMILAENLYITSENGTDITVNWKAPGDVVVDQWKVTCLSSQGDTQEVTVSEPSATFTGMHPAAVYTIDVTASGMTQAAQTKITANPLQVTALTIDDSPSNTLNLSWDYSGGEASGWQILYSLTGGSQNSVACQDASGSISPKIPGAKYSIVLQSTNGATVFNSVYSYTVPEAAAFAAHELTADQISAKLLKTPETAGWLVEKLSEEVYTTVFAPGEKISVALAADTTFYRPSVKTQILYVIRDAYGNILPQLVSQEDVYWNSLWNSGNVKNAELDVPAAPTSAGEYILELYFDGMAVAKLPFSIR